MSLKAKIEAVIYASEEPVTLAQLVGLLGEEAQAELDALSAQQTLLDLGEAESSAQPEESAAESEPEPENGAAAEAEAAAEPELSPKPEPEPTAESTAEPAAEPAAEAEAASGPPAPSEEEARKLSRQRERMLREYFRSLLDSLVTEYATGDRGLEIREVAGGFRLGTKPEYHDAVRGFVKSLKPPLKLSLQALETLAVVAYKQPVTAPEVSEIRGVDSGGVLAGLMTRKLVATAGRKAVIGRPILYKTTKEFLVRFGLRDINELPSIEEFERMASELAAEEPMQEEIPMEQAPRNNASENNASEEDASAGNSAALDELNSAPESAGTLHETTAETESDKSQAPSGHETEPAGDVERMRDVHEAQADGIPDTDSPDHSADREEGGDAQRAASGENHE